MGAAKRLATFLEGSIIGTAAGAVAGLLLAPESGRQLRASLEERLRRARLAGITAQAAKEEELIRKFRAEVNDPEALRSEEESIRNEVAEAVQALGLSFTAPGASAAQDAGSRQPERSTTGV